MVRRTRGCRPASRFQRWLRRAARIVVAAFAMVALLGGTGVAQAVAATMLASGVSPTKCACEHVPADGPTIDALCRCCTRDRGTNDGLAGSCCSTAVAPAAATPVSHGGAVAAAACVGLIDDAYESPLLGRAAELDLDRPPRA